MKFRPMTRRCVLCLTAKPMTGGRTSGDGKRFVCAECRAKREAGRVPQVPATEGRA